MSYQSTRVGLGRVFLILAYVLLFVAVAVLPLVIIRLHGVAEFSSPWFRQVLAVVFFNIVVHGTLGWFMWGGHVWARWIIALLLFITGFILLTYLQVVQGSTLLALVANVVLDLSLAASVAFSGAIGDYLDDRERSRRINL